MSMAVSFISIQIQFITGELHCVYILVKLTCVIQRVSVLHSKKMFKGDGSSFEGGGGFKGEKTMGF